MGYTILQTELSFPPVENLRRAFRSVSCLTDLDAQTLARDAYGILVKRLSAEDAGRLQSALAAEGIATEVVPDQSLPPLPPARMVRQLECREEALMLFDPLGRSFPLAWRHVMLLAAGTVALPQFDRVEKERTRIRFNGAGHPYSQTERDYSTRERIKDNQVLEIIVSRAVIRYTVNAAGYNFRSLGDRVTGDARRNFALLVQDLMRHAPSAVVNRGAHDIGQEAAEAIYYPSKNAFHEEIIWLLWRLQRAG